MMVSDIDTLGVTSSHAARAMLHASIARNRPLKNFPLQLLLYRAQIEAIRVYGKPMFTDTAMLSPKSLLYPIPYKEHRGWHWAPITYLGSGSPDVKGAPATWQLTPREVKTAIVNTLDRFAHMDFYKLRDSTFSEPVVRDAKRRKEAMVPVSKLIDYYTQAWICDRSREVATA